MKQLDDWISEITALDPSQRDDAIRGAPAEWQDDLRDAVSSYIQASGFFEQLARDLHLPSAPTVIPSNSALVGTTLAQYRIIEPIGEGGMGAVYRAEDTRLGRTVALKLLPSSMGADSRAQERFLREAQSASSLDHPNICTIFEIGNTDGRAWIAMACYEGSTLRHLMERGPMDVDSALDIVLQIASGLGAAHARGVVHRDVKPENVIVLPDGLVKILDFGLAKGADDATVTQEGTMLGTAGYMSPEQASGRKADHRTDVWAVGVMLYEMLAGERPFPGAYPQAVLYGILNADPESLSGRRSGLPLALVEVVERLLQKDPDHRFAGMQDVTAALEAVRSRAAAKSEVRERIQGIAGPALRAESDGDSGGTAPPDDDVLYLMCVDDEPELELLMQQRFRKKIRAGEWQFVFALDGQDALTKLEAHPEIGVILTDLNMPRMDGLTLLGRLSEMDRPLRTVVVSAYGDLEKIRTAMNRGAYDFVTKPIDFKDLEVTIDKAAADLATYRRALRGQQQAVSIHQEMDVARRIQDAILPVSFPEGTFGFSSPAGEINATFYDAFSIDDDRVGLIVGEVHGRTVTSTLLLAMGQTFVKGLLQQGVAPVKAVGMLNRMLFADDLPNVALNLGVAVANRASGDTVVVNAGLDAVMVLRAGGSVEPLTASGASVWSETDSEWDEMAVSMAPGDALVLASRGCVRALGENGQPFSAERLAATLRELEDTRPTAIIRSVLRSVGDHVGSAVMRDDQTLVAMRREA